MDEFIGKQFGRYKLVDLLGGSEIARVYKAYDTRLDRTVALKMVLHSQEYNQDFVDHFLQEARALAQLSHPNIVKVLDYGQDQDHLFLVMEYIPGKTLNNHVSDLTVAAGQGKDSKEATPAATRSRQLDWRVASRLILPVADALEYAHSQGVIHRDLKPANILMDAEGQPVLSDFSLTRILEEEETREMTGTNVGLGAPAYMSPEQGKGLPVDYRADIYSLGIIFYELVTGRLPFIANSGMEVVIQQVSTEPTAPGKLVPGLPSGVEKIILTALKKNPEARFASMGEMIDALRQQLREAEMAGQGGRSRRRAILVVVIGVPAGLGLLGIAWWLLVVSGLFPPLFHAPEKRNGFLPSSPSPSAFALHSTFTPEMTASSQTANQPASTSTSQLPQSSPTASPARGPGARLPALPVIGGRSLPASGQAISLSNLTGLRELARWGQYRLNDLIWSPDNRMLLGGTSAGVYFYVGQPPQENLKGDLLAELGFFEARGWITHLAISADGLRIATSDQTGKIRVWEAETGKLIADLTGHPKGVTRLAFSPNGTRLASASLDGSVIVWDIQAEKAQTTFTQHTHAVNGLVYVDEDRIISGGEDFKIFIWNPADGEPYISPIRASSPVLALALAPGGQILAAGLTNTTVELWDIQSRSKLEPILKDTSQVEPVTALSFPSEGSGQILATGAQDGYLRVWNIRSGIVQVKEFAGNPAHPDKTADSLLRVEFSNDGTRLASLTQGGNTVIWQLNVLDNYHQAVREFQWLPVKQVELSPDQATLAFQTENRQVQIWKTSAGSLLGTAPGLMAPGTIFAHHSQNFAILDGDIVQVYGIGSVTPKIEKPLFGIPVNGSLAFLTDDLRLGASGTRDLRLWSLALGLVYEPGDTRYEDNCKYAYTTEGIFQAAGSELGLFDQEVAAKFFCTIPKNRRFKSQAFTSDGRYFAFGQDDGKVQLWDSVKDEKPEYLLPPEPARAGEHSSPILSVAFSQDGMLLATGDANGLIRLWDLETRTRLDMTLDHHHGAVYDLFFSVDGGYLLTASYDGTVQIWGILSD
jgi:eukaryotic-like serine/threonine-protein kinase